jgi:hypothetical protein
VNEAGDREFFLARENGLRGSPIGVHPTNRRASRRQLESDAILYDSCRSREHRAWRLDAGEFDEGVAARLARSPALVAVASPENCPADGFGVKQGEIRGNRGFDPPGFIAVATTPACISPAASLTFRLTAALRCARRPVIRRALLPVARDGVRRHAEHVAMKEPSATMARSSASSRSLLRPRSQRAPREDGWPGVDSNGENWVRFASLTPKRSGERLFGT